MLRSSLQIYANIIEGLEFNLFEPNMDYSTLDPPTSPDLLFMYANFSGDSVFRTIDKKAITVVDCLERGVYVEGPISTIMKATIFVDINKPTLPNHNLQIIQQIGFALGLHQNDDPNSIMYSPPIQRCLVNGTLNSADVKRINQLYFTREQVLNFFKNQNETI